ncbi:hypothetical protein A3I95_02880 [Candidatus Nomurabacteria bacterium RIFCSPLOWO2_02_FULL_44_12]|uniref:Uncharacterized protein n=1 Tax=Candidatus Nomurabacteria bacterium RIFCSPLOWO2_12_FULL_44_11 TaxID=1801796 RepID=A0A1F6Y5L8_9BACT|nr:MAG: hypothetical protein A3E95_02670 [Candidatus Nomurabacteria bacterium RIFCSPHIGHO2_12_FULL_44_22b]OGJ01615.1 MAG: hypothetical protein A3G53_02525 [Candidatus Nomurabacteria bacterium RIFCSPLOWO2_12_FULL_44_11]OGJ08214.1 MAG: hypothetical protein A3I95_02880 [Candidatus Nomurabacteria bacterium RIFCSPLOWO2_02_FULL_44_12]
MFIPLPKQGRAEAICPFIIYQPVSICQQKKHNQNEPGISSRKPNMPPRTKAELGTGQEIVKL